MKIKTVSTVLAVNSAGQVVESRPVREVDGPVLNTAGFWVQPVPVEEANDGIPVRFVSDAVVLNSAGQPVAATPVKGGGGYSFKVTESILGAGGLDYALYDSSALDRMWQEATGITPAANGNTVGLVIGREKQQSKTFDQVLALQPELKGAGFGDTQGGYPTPPTYDPVTGIGSVGRTTSSIQSRVNFTGYPVGSLFYVDIENTGLSNLTVRTSGGGLYFTITPGQRRSARCVVNSNATISIRMNNDNTETTFVLHSFKKIPIHYAVQDVTGARPNLQSEGPKFDGSDDNMLSDWIPQAGANCIIAKAKIPTGFSNHQVIAGTSEASSDRFWLSVDGANGGRLRSGIGTNNNFFAVGDLSGLSVIAAIVCDGAQAKLYLNGVEVATTAQSGGPSTVTPLRIGALNTAGSPGGYFAGNVKQLAFGRVAPTGAQMLQIYNEWLAAA